MAIRSTTATVTTTAAKFVTGTDTDGARGTRNISIRNTGTVTIYLGGSDVTTTNGYPLAGGEGLDMNETATGDLPYAVVASGTCTVAVLETGV